MANAILNVESCGETLGSAGREKMKTLHVVADGGRFPKLLKNSEIFPAIKLDVYI